MNGLIRGNDEVQDSLTQQISKLQQRLSELEKIALTSKSAALKYEPLRTTDQRKANAWMAMRTMPLLFPNLRGSWLMNQWAPGFVYDASSQERHMTTHGTLAFNQQNNLLRYLTLDGTSTYLSRPSEAAYEFTNTHFGVMSWAYKGASGTQFLMLAKTQGLTASANQAFFFTVGSSDNLNLTVCNGVANYNHAIAAPVGEWFFGAGAYAPGASITLYLGTQDGWQASSNTTGIPASINNPTTTDLTIGATHGGANLGGGRIALSAIMQSGGNETLFRTFFDHTKDIFYL